MKRLIIWLAILLPLFANAQIWDAAPTQKERSTGTIRSNAGSRGLDTLTRVTGALVDGWILKYHAATNKWYASPDPTSSLYWQRSGGTLSPINSGDSVNIGTGIYKGHALRSDASDGVQLQAANGTLSASFGVGNTANASIAGAVTIAGNILNTNTSAGTAGTDSLLVKDDAGNIIKRISPTYYSPALSTTTISNGGTTNGISTSGGQIRLHKVNATNGGVLTTGADTISGEKSFTSTLNAKRLDIEDGQRILLFNPTNTDYFSFNTTATVDTLSINHGGDRKAYFNTDGSFFSNGNISATDLFIRHTPTLVTGTQYIAVRDSTTGLVKQIKTTSLPVNSGSGNYIQNQFSTAQSGFYKITGYGEIQGSPGTFQPSLKIGTNSNIPTQAGITVNLNYTPSNTETAHAFADRSDFSIKGSAYNSYDISPTFSGTDVSVVTDHYVGLQFTPSTTDTTRFDRVYGLDFHPYLTKASGNTIAAVNVDAITGTWTNKYALRSTQSDVDISIAGRSYSNGMNSSGTIVSTYNGTSPIFLNSSGNTNVQYFDVYNTGGRFWLGNNNSAGTSLPGSTAYSTVLTTVGSQPLQFGTNGTIRQTISASGDVTFPGNISANNLASGTFTPILTNELNVASSTAGTGSYIRVGNQVSGFVDFTATGTGEGVSGTIGVSLPISSNFSSSTNASGGFGVGRSGETLAPLESVSADTTNDRFTVVATLTDLSSRTIRINFQYTIL